MKYVISDNVMSHLYRVGEKNLIEAIEAGDLGRFLWLKGDAAQFPLGVRQHGVEVTTKQRSSTPMTTASIESVLQRARTALPANVALTGNGEGYQRLPGLSGAAASRGNLRLSDAMPRLPQASTRAFSPGGEKAGGADTLGMAILRGSRVAQAGARIIPIELAPAPNHQDQWTRAGGFSVLSGANFAQGDETTPLVAQSLPSVTEDINLDKMEQYGVRFELGRRAQKDTAPGELDARIVVGIAHGIANLADRVALAKIEEKLLAAGGGTMQTYSLAAAASAGLRFNELRAIIGRNGISNGAEIEGDKLRVDGIPAELCGEHDATFVGAFDRLAVAVMDDIRVLVERTRLDGGLAVTCWVDMLALAPDPDRFFWVGP